MKQGRGWMVFWYLVIACAIWTGFGFLIKRQNDVPDIRIYSVDLGDSTKVMCAVTRWGDGITCDWDRRK